MAWKKIKVENTTNNHTKGIINFLLSEGHSASRINTQGQFEPVTTKHRAYRDIVPALSVLRRFGLIAGAWRKSGSREGYYDISACLKCRSGIGVFHVIDFKGENDRLRPEQKRFKAEVIKSGGIPYEATSLEVYMKYYYTHLKPNIIDKF